MRALKFPFVMICLIFSTVLTGQDETKLDHKRNIMIDSSTVNTESARQVKGTPLSAATSQNKVQLDRDASLMFLQKIYSTSGLWRRSSDPLREAIGVLIYHASRLPVDSTAAYLSEYDFDKLTLPPENIYVLDTVRIIVPVLPSDSTTADSSSVLSKPGEMFIEAGDILEKIRLSKESRPVISNDTLVLNDSVYISMKEFVPAKLPQRTHDTIILIVTDTLPDPVFDRKEYPFRSLLYPFISDTLGVAVKTLIGYLGQRDSTLLTILSETGKGTTVWLNGRSDDLVRFWLPDGKSDSVTVWVGNPQRNTLTLNVEEGVLFRKQLWHDQFVDTKVNVTTAVEEELRKVDLMKIKPILWKYRTDASYLLSQGWIENWAKGGESNISSVLDVTEYIDYSNKVSKVTANTTVRFALGFQKSGETPIRKNLDILEINSKVNHKAFGKFDLSGIFQFKTQILPGKIYPTDTTEIVVSKFFNPATLILGYGLDYKPNKNTSINFSPVSYKGTFVPDSSKIIKTKYGVPEDRKSKNEMGAYLTISNKTKLFGKVDMTNKIQFFSNFLSKPQNVDVDWEVIMTTSLNWFTEVRLNMHLIYDDNTLLPVHKNGEDVKNPDGSTKTAPMAQFKELLGLSFVFKF